MNEVKARFIDRTKCIVCGSTDLAILSSGNFIDEPLHSLIESDPWGESPIPYISDEKWIFVKCSNCSMAFHNRILAPEWIERCYKDWITQEAMQEYLALRVANNWHFNAARERVAHVLRLHELTQNIRTEEPLRILDFGCGWGEFLLMCDQFGFKCYGIDFAPDRQKYAHIPILPGFSELNFALSGARNFFHAITLFEVLEHLADPLKILQELNELMMPGGILILETPDCTGVANISNRREYDKIDPLNHINGFTPATLRQIAENAGFQSINRGVAQVTCKLNQVIRTEGKRVIGRLLKPKTEQYFSKVY